MSDPPPDRPGHGPHRYEIRVDGHLSPRWAAWFGDLTLTAMSDGTTVLRGPAVDQAALHGLLRKVRDAGLPLLCVTQVGLAPPTPPPPIPDDPHAGE
ncbi:MULTISPECIES: hypothetical protein [unclassified Pseudofrankia]|uniref:hypothetical protein n=1 Tax=unclassified Pseudofrankia TaxID=2994372 RepID=UPI0008DB1C83|nr:MULTISPECIES: hypothetical protein [unclassified Pseudofrankia]MDT3438786.1 hypothetical protein [Pseudofrankia sp. BMG5.37]OHV75175.1 hypothetical protein BCD48_00020 [Pseudofrankia sp. BMG5.36]